MHNTAGQDVCKKTTGPPPGIMLKYAGEYCEVGDASCRSCIADAGIT